MKEKNSFKLTAKSSDRLDRYLARETAIVRSNISRSQVKKLINRGLVRVNSRHAPPSFKVVEGDKIFVSIPQDEIPKYNPEDIPLQIVYEDKYCLVIDKQSGLVVHPGSAHKSGTLVNAILHHLKKSPTTDFRLGIVHRLDKETSGLMVVAKNIESESDLKRQFQYHSVLKIYKALVVGKLTKASGLIDRPIGRNPKNRQKFTVIVTGRSAQTEYKVIEEYPGYSLVELRLKTGRTHQIRVHLASLGHPVVGDKIYGRKNQSLGLDRQFLHANKLGFDHPKTKKRLEFNSPLPKELKEVLKDLELNYG